MSQGSHQSPPIPPRARIIMVTCAAPLSYRRISGTAGTGNLVVPDYVRTIDWYAVIGNQPRNQTLQGIELGVALPRKAADWISVGPTFQFNTDGLSVISEIPAMISGIGVA